MNCLAFKLSGGRVRNGWDCSPARSQQLYDVSDRLDSLADQHPPVSEALITFQEAFVITATLLDVLVAMTIAPIPGLDPASA